MVPADPQGCRQAPALSCPTGVGGQGPQQLSLCGSPGPLHSLATNTLSSLKTSENLFGSRYVGFPLGAHSAVTHLPGALPGLEGQWQARPDI